MMTDKQKKYLLLKRGIDIVLSGGAIVVLSPVLGLLAIAIKLDSPGPVLFKQKRTGKRRTQKTGAVPENRIFVRREPAWSWKTAGRCVRSGNRVFQKDHVSGLAEPDRGRICSEYL